MMKSNGQRKTSPRQYFMADFETTTDPKDCRVWEWGVIPIGESDMIWGCDIESFVNWCSSLRSVVYFHNLAFDGSFILDWLLRNGYRHGDKLYRTRTFTTLISHDGKFYNIHVKWVTGNTTEFRDSFKKIPLSVSRIAKSYGGSILKGEIDYHAKRPVGHIPTPEELDYLETDIRIVANALDQQFKQGMKKLTTGADSLNEFKQMFGSKAFDTMFPVLSVSMDTEIRKAYRGGWTYVAPKYQAKIVGGGYVYDVNSLYSYVMKSKLLPYGVPSYFKGAPPSNPLNPLWIASLTFTAKLRENHLPCIQVKGTPYFQDTDYQTEIVEPTTLACTNVDFDLWNEHYELDIISWNGGFAFTGAHGFFDEYIKKWSKVKAESTGGLREIAKLHLNSLYGKFATNPDVTGKVPVLNEDGEVKLIKGPDEMRNPVYTPMGVFITAYAREHTIKAAQSNYDTFAYADTDSLHLITDKEPENLEIHSTEIGCWKRELRFNSAIYVRAKCYSEKVELPRLHRKQPRVKYFTHIAGLPSHIASKVTFADFYNGRIFKGKLVPQRVRGGIVLRETEYTLAFPPA